VTRMRVSVVARMRFCAALLCIGLGFRSAGAQTTNGVANTSDLEWPLPPARAAYGNIDGKRLWQYVVEQADIAHHYRDSGHPQFWGRIVGTSGDVEDAQWLLSKFQQIGLSDTHIQAISLFMPQWSADSWEVTATVDGKTIRVPSAQAEYGSPNTDGKGLDLPLAYVGLGSDADLQGRDISGKAVLLVKGQISYQIGAADVLKRLQEKGAAAILSMDLRGGNLNAQSYRAYTKVPAFNIGTEDGHALQEMIGKAQPENPPHVKIRLDSQWVKDQKTALVWGTLPGATDETIYVIAHRDGWFDAVGDNASGVASMLGLAEHFAKIPKSQRKRTIIFIGTDGHHQIKPGAFGESWLVANRAKFFAKTALMINDEHPAEMLTHGGVNGNTNVPIPLEWYAGGSSRPELEKIVVDAFHDFGVPFWTNPSKNPPAGDLGRFYWFVPGVDAQANDFVFMHTTADTPENVPWTGLEATTRAYAKIIDEVNKLPLSALQRPEAANPQPPGTPQGYIVSLENCAAWIEDSSKTCNVNGELPW
jgi:Peptidase family M28